MKSLHIHLSVPDLDEGIRFYNQMFGMEPTRTKDDYAKWQLEDPRVNFAISTRSQKVGLDHLGIQYENEDELQAFKTRLDDSGINNGELSDTTCCYAESLKFWSLDPAGVPWEGFVTMKDAEIFGVDTANTGGQQSSACCEGFPARVDGPGCC